MTAMNVIEQAVAAAGADLAEAHEKHLAAFREAVAEATRLRPRDRDAEPLGWTARRGSCASGADD